MIQDTVNKEDIDRESALLKAVVESPAWAAVKKAVKNYEAQVLSQLLEEKDANKIFELRGRIIGARVIDRLPELLVGQRKLKSIDKVKKS